MDKAGLIASESIPCAMGIKTKPACMYSPMSFHITVSTFVRTFQGDKPYLILLSSLKIRCWCTTVFKQVTKRVSGSHLDDLFCSWAERICVLNEAKYILGNISH